MLAEPPVPNVQFRSFPTTRVLHRDKAEQNEFTHLRIRHRRVLIASHGEINCTSEISADIGRRIGDRRTPDYVYHEHVLFVTTRIWPITQKKLSPFMKGIIDLDLDVFREAGEATIGG